MRVIYHAVALYFKVLLQFCLTVAVEVLQAAQSATLSQWHSHDVWHHKPVLLTGSQFPIDTDFAELCAGRRGLQ